MKKLDLNAWGVDEMSAVKMNETDGGFICGGFCLTLLGVAIGIALTQDLDSLKAAYEKGYKAANQQDKK